MPSIHAIKAFSDNYIWCIADHHSQRALAVDPGQAEPLLAWLEAQELTLDTVLITHHHPDHTGGVRKLRQQIPGLRVYGPAQSPFKDLDQPCQEHDEVSWGAYRFQVLAVPGHTLDHIAFYCQQAPDGEPLVFCGDTLFVCGCGRLFEGSPATMRQSLAKLAALPETTRVYCTHEYTLANLAFARHILPQDSALAAFARHAEQRRADGLATVPTDIATERRLNPFLRWADPEVIDAARRQTSQPSEALMAGDADAVFAAIRAAKDTF